VPGHPRSKRGLFPRILYGRGKGACIKGPGREINREADKKKLPKGGRINETVYRDTDSRLLGGSGRKKVGVFSKVKKIERSRGRGPPPILRKDQGGRLPLPLKKRRNIGLEKRRPADESRGKETVSSPCKKGSLDEGEKKSKPFKRRCQRL